MFVFLLISLVVVVAAVTLALVGSGGRPGAPPRGAPGGLADVPPDLLDEPLPAERAVTHADVAGLRLAVGVRGYRMDQVDDVLDRLGAELAERDARIAELESALAGAQAVAIGRGEGSSVTAEAQEIRERHEPHEGPGTRPAHGAPTTWGADEEPWGHRPNGRPEGDQR